MKLETFFEKFEMFADAPNAVARMRELVLTLAVQGKLVPQDPEDEPADSILRATHSLFDRLVGAKKLSPPKPLQPIEDDEMQYSLPNGWAWCRFGQIMRISSGDGLVAKDMNAGPIPVYGGNGVNGYHDAHNVAKRTLVIGRVGFYCGSIHVTPEKAWVTDNAFITTFDEEHVNLNFLSWLLKATDIRERDNATAQPVISGGKVYPTVLALPPLAEQRRIVAKVDELMALCDRLEAQQQERVEKHKALSRASLARFADAPTPANLQFIFHPSFTIAPADLRKSILTLAVQGKLVPQDPNDELAEWPTVSMKEVCDLITDGEHATPQRVSSGVPLATAKNVRDGFLDMAQTDYVAQETAVKCWRRCKPKHGDILMVCVGATTGRVCLVTNPPDMVLVRSVALLRPNMTLIEGRFLDLFLRSPSGQTQIWGGVRQNAQPCLYLGKMSEFTIHLPPLAEQRRIVAKVEELMKLVDALETQLAISRATAANLLAAIVAELTGTPNDAKVSVPASTNSGTGTGRRGRPPKS